MKLNRMQVRLVIIMHLELHSSYVGTRNTPPNVIHPVSCQQSSHPLILTLIPTYFDLYTRRLSRYDVAKSILWTTASPYHKVLLK